MTQESSGAAGEDGRDGHVPTVEEVLRETARRIARSRALIARIDESLARNRSLTGGPDDAGGGGPVPGDAGAGGPGSGD